MFLTMMVMYSNPLKLYIPNKLFLLKVSLAMVLYPSTRKVTEKSPQDNGRVTKYTVGYK